jgi:hypothetical protein
MFEARSIYEEIRNAYKILDSKSKGKRPLGRSRCRWKVALK